MIFIFVVFYILSILFYLLSTRSVLFAHPLLAPTTILYYLFSFISYLCEAYCLLEPLLAP